MIRRKSPLISALVLFLAGISFVIHSKTPVVLLSIDGFANDYLEQYQPKNLKRIISTGLKAKALKPVFPSKTFPNHISMVTGVYPAQHGIIHNRFYNKKLKKKYKLGAAQHDATWLRAMPIWGLAEQKGLTTAIYFWPESQAQLNDFSPTYNFPYRESTSNQARFEQIIAWLRLPEDKRPDFIASYFSTVDTAGHLYGPDSIQLTNEIVKIDKLMGKFFDVINNEFNGNVNLIIVSDHGMVKTGPEHTILWDELFPSQKGLTVVNGQTQLYVYADNNKLNDVRSHIVSASTKKIKGKSVQRFNVYDQNSFPKHWHFNQKSHVMPELIIDAIPPFTFIDEDEHLSQATHGFDPYYNEELDAIFIASGPSFKKDITVEPFENIHVFALLASLLNVKKPKNNSAIIDPFLKGLE